MWLYILDYRNCRIIELYMIKRCKDIESFLERKNFNLDEVSYMISENKLTIQKLY